MLTPCIWLDREMFSFSFLFCKNKLTYFVHSFFVRFLSIWSLFFISLKMFLYIWVFFQRIPKNNRKQLSASKRMYDSVIAIHFYYCFLFCLLNEWIWFDSSKWIRTLFTKKNMIIKQVFYFIFLFLSTKNIII